MPTGHRMPSPSLMRPLTLYFAEGVEKKILLLQTTLLRCIIRKEEHSLLIFPLTSSSFLGDYFSTNLGSLEQQKNAYFSAHSYLIPFLSCDPNGTLCTWVLHIHHQIHSSMHQGMHLKVHPINTPLDAPFDTPMVDTA